MKTKGFAIALGLSALSMAAPAQATWWNWGGCKINCNTSSSTSSSTSGHTTSGNTTTGGTTTTTTTGGSSGGTSGGTQVPEPGALGLFAAAIIGIGFARRRRRLSKNA
jgi:hypothetical protein